MEEHASHGLEFPKENDYHGHPNYTKVFFFLLLLLGISLVVGYFISPLVAVAIIFITAIIKGGLVIANFMHLKFEPKLMWLLIAIVLFIGLAFFFGVYPDIIPIERTIVK